MFFSDNMHVLCILYVFSAISTAVTGHEVKRKPELLLLYKKVKKGIDKQKDE